MDRLRYRLSGLFCSLNIYIQSFARLVWSQALDKPDNRLARLSKRQLPLNALNAVLGCCVLSTLCIYALKINLDTLLVYANGIFIMIYLLCMLAGCRLLKGRYKALAFVGGLLCLLLLAMVGWKSMYAIVMLAVLWLALVGPVNEAPPATKSPIVFVIQTVVLFILTLILPFKRIARTGTKNRPAYG
ncbi:inner membrane YjeH domain protein [Enterobacter roggenkampii]|nr:inner membrane YjeH domain protein [Enterobacter roggenkampii]